MQYNISIAFDRLSFDSRHAHCAKLRRGSDLYLQLSAAVNRAENTIFPKRIIDPNGRMHLG